MEVVVPYQFTILEPGLVIVLRLSETVKATDITDYFKEVRLDTAFRVGMHRIVDCRSVTDYEIDFAQMRNIRSQETSRIEASRRRVITVFIVDSDLNLGMARMYQSLSEIDGLQDVYITHSPAEAIEALSLGDEAARDARAVLATDI